MLSIANKVDPLYFPLRTCIIPSVVVILFGLDCFINSVFSLCLYSAHTLFDNKLELVICNLRV